MVLAYDFLDSMAWVVSISGFLLALAAISLRYKPTTASIEEKDMHFRVGFGAAIALCGSYLFLTGLSISFTWPFAISSGVYNVLFGGIATLGGLVLLAGAIVLFFNANPRPVSYFAAIVGLYGYAYKKQIIPSGVDGVDQIRLLVFSNALSNLPHPSFKEKINGKTQGGNAGQVRSVS